MLRHTGCDEITARQPLRQQSLMSRLTIFGLF